MPTYIDTPNGRTALCPNCKRQPLHTESFFYSSERWRHSVGCVTSHCRTLGLHANSFEGHEAALKAWNELVEGLDRQEAARFSGAGAMGAI